MYTHRAGRKPALQQNWQSSENHNIFREKNTIFNEHPVPAHKNRISEIVELRRKLVHEPSKKLPYMALCNPTGFFVLRIRTQLYKNIERSTITAFHRLETSLVQSLVSYLL